jgi:predicted transcriptional regulator YdeE
MVEFAVTNKRKITLVGIDFYGNPYKEAGAWSMQNAIGQLWKRFDAFYDKNKHKIRNLELVAKTLPETRYAIFTLKGDAIKSDWPSQVATNWLAAAGLERSYPYIIEYYDSKRYKGVDDKDAELDIYVPVR